MFPFQKFSNLSSYLDPNNLLYYGAIGIGVVGVCYLGYYAYKNFFGGPGSEGASELVNSTVEEISNSSQSEISSAATPLKFQGISMYDPCWFASIGELLEGKTLLLSSFQSGYLSDRIFGIMQGCLEPPLNSGALEIMNRCAIDLFQIYESGVLEPELHEIVGSVLHVIGVV